MLEKFNEREEEISTAYPEEKQNKNLKLYENLGLLDSYLSDVWIVFACSIEVHIHCFGFLEFNGIFRAMGESLSLYNPNVK